MEQRPDIRIKFREWLIEQQLDPETAYGILESVPPYDWSLIARRDEVNGRFDRVETRIDRVETRIDQFDAKLDRVATDLGDRIDGMGDRIDSLSDRNDGRIDGMGDRIDGFVEQMAVLNRTLAAGALTLAVTLVLGFASLGAGMLFTA